MSHTSIKTIFTDQPEGKTVSIQGWLRTKREAKTVIFLEVNDGSCLKSLQVVVDKDSGLIDENMNHRLLTGAAVTISGQVHPGENHTRNIEIRADSINLIGDSPAEYPLQKKRHSFEFLREIAHLRPRTNTFGAIARIRNTLARAVHNFFQEQGFLWIHTPIITGNDAEGAGNMFQVTSLDIENPPRTPDGKIDYTRDFFGRQAHLTVSGQLQVENYACSLSRVYTFGPTFRAENSNTSRHLAEFWMVEPEMAFCDLDNNRQLAEDCIKYLLSTVLTESSEDMAFFDQWIEKGVVDSLQKVIDAKFVHLTYTQAITELQKAKTKFEFSPVWGTDLQAEHERYLTETVIGGPIIVTDYPKDIKAFYMKLNEDGKTVRAMDVLVPRIGEIIGGSQREDNIEKLETRIREMGMDPEEYWWYLDLRRYGSVPHSGFGLGFERFVQYVTGQKNIRDVMPFPRAPKTIGF